MSILICKLFALVCLLGVVFAAPATDMSNMDEITVDLQIENDLDELYESEPRLFTLDAFNLSSILPFNQLDNELVERLESLQNWNFPKFNQQKCRGLRKVLDSDIQELNEIEKPEYSYSRKENELFRKALGKVQLLKRFPSIRKITKSIEYNIGIAEKVRARTMRRRNNRIEKYYRDIENRITSIVTKPLGAKLQDKMLRNATYRLMTDQQMREVRRALEMLGECLSDVTLNTKYQYIAQFAKHLLKMSQKYESYADSLKSAVKFNLLADDETASTIFHDAILSVPIDSVIERRSDDDDEDYDHDDDNEGSKAPKPSSMQEMSKVLKPIEKTEAPKKLVSLYSKFVSLLGSITYESVASTCNIPANKEVNQADKKEANVPAIAENRFIDEIIIQELTESYPKIRKNYRYLENMLNTLGETSQKYEKSLKKLIRYKIEPLYQAYVKSIVTPALGANIKISKDNMKKCSITDLKENQTFVSKAQIELALAAIERERACLDEFGQVPLAKIQMAPLSEISLLQNDIDAETTDKAATDKNATNKDDCPSKAKDIYGIVKKLKQRIQDADDVTQTALTSVKF